MSDQIRPPRPPRPSPPPLPSRTQQEPSLGDTPPPDAWRRNHSTPPSGSLLLSHLVDNLSDDPKDVIIRELKQTNKLCLDKITELSRAATKASPATAAPVSLRTMTKRELAKVGGKWTFLLVLLPIVGGILAKRWPEYSSVVNFVLSLLPVKLTELDPIFTQSRSNGALTERTGVIFDCPCGNADDLHRCYVPFANPIGPGPVTSQDGWVREGETFETLTLKPSIFRSPEKGGCGWHGFITQGEVRERMSLLCRLGLHRFRSAYLYAPLRCTRCGERK